MKTRDMEDIQRSQTDLLKVEDSNIWDENYSRLNTEEKKISKLEDTVTEVIQNETQR